LPSRNLLRFVLGWEITVNGLLVPVWPSGIVFVITAGLAVMVCEKLARLSQGALFDRSQPLPVLPNPARRAGWRRIPSTTFTHLHDRTTNELSDAVHRFDVNELRAFHSETITWPG